MKKIFTMMIISCLLFAVGFGDVSRASANEITPEAFIQSEDPLVESEEMIDHLMKAAGDFALVEMYAQNATIQTQVMFEKLEEISMLVDVVQPLDTHLEEINQSANRWLDDLKPQLQQTTQDIITFTNTFEVLTDPLRQAIEEDNQEDFLWAIQYLEDEIDRYATRTQDLTDDLVSYADDLKEIEENLSSDYANIQEALEGEDGTLAELRDELNELEEELEKLNEEHTTIVIAFLVSGGSAAAIGIGIGIWRLTPILTPGGPLLGFGVFLAIAGAVTLSAIFVPLQIIGDEIKNVKNEILNKTNDLEQIEREYAVLSHINTEVETLLDLATEAQTGAQGLQDSWENMKDKFTKLRESVDQLDWELAQPLLLEKIEVTDEEAQEINEYAKNLQLEYEVIIEEPEE